MKNRSSHFDILIYVFPAVMAFSYYKGYSCYVSRKPAETGFWSLCCAVFLVLFIRRFCYLRYLHMKISRIDRLSGKAFEQYLAAQFRHQGYKVAETEASHDYGADLLLKKRREKIVVQAKRYDKNVGLAAVQEAAGAVAYYKADKAMVVTNSRFTRSARKLARQNDVDLWGREEIIERFGIRT